MPTSSLKKVILFFLMLFIVSNLSFSQKNDSINPVLTDKFLINAGIFTPAKKVKFGFKSSDNPNGKNIVDFDKTFKMSGLQSSFIFDIKWRFSTYWSVNSSYFRIGNKKSIELQNDLEWNDITFKAGTGIEGSFAMSIYKIFFGRVISKGNKHELGGGLGIHAFVLNGYIKGQVLVNEDEYKYKKSNISATIPLPNVGLWYIYAPFNKLSLTTRFDWFGITIDEYSGSLWNFNAGLNYRVLKNIGLNVSYKYLKVTANVNKRLWNGDFYMKFHGPVFTVSGNF